MVTRILLGIVGLLLATAVHAETARVFLDTQLTGDSDDAHQNTYLTGYRQTPANSDGSAAWEAAAGLRILEAPAGRESFRALRGSLQSQLGGIETRLTLNPLFGDNWSPVLGALTLNRKFGEDWYLEAAAERELVDTVIAVRARNLINSYSLSADYRLAHEWTLIGVALLQTLSDDNSRRGGQLKLSYSPDRFEGLTLQLRGKRLDSDFRGIGYFSPLQLEEYTALLRYSRPVWNERFRFSTQLAAGVQRVDAVETKPIYSGEAAVRGFLTEHWGVESKLGAANTGGLDASAADGAYHYLYGGINLFYAW